MASVKFTFLRHHLDLKVVNSTLGHLVIGILSEIRHWCWERICSEKLQRKASDLDDIKVTMQNVKDNQMCPKCNLFGFQVVT